MNHRPRPHSRKSSSSPPPVAYRIGSHPPATMSNPSLSQHARYPFAHSRPQQPRRHSALHPRRPSNYPSYSPNRASSSTALSPEGASASSTPKGALKVLSSVKRSFSLSTPKKSGPSPSFTTTSTAEETAAGQIRLSDSDASRPPPTVQQIAAGFVTGLRPRSSPRAPPPPRSSLKKSTTSSTSTSSSTSLASTSLMSTRTGSTTTAATSVASSRRPRFSLKDALFGRSGTPITPITTASRKAVRFHVDRSPNTESSPLPS
ncbi:hypothetical protein RSOLAG22IIIB_08123 [Rhizoctonia solani]|uniref:Uncharacterized protein n=1 Tax=Rhizoctonia solani TaxID=456999 RepID=A0A0K6FRN3_9AGAM|nr:hypothetical protein RSOLAG22IIIB_08123 [Rhizoctonia solani]